jgi:predicted enzyme related to lactoylglutathione lyase
MSQPKLRFLGVELYFDNLDAAKKFYRDTLHLQISDERLGHYARFGPDSGFICLERKGLEAYPSMDKAVLFFETPDLPALIEKIGHKKIVHSEPESADRPAWAVIHDPEGHNILLLQERE